VGNDAVDKSSRGKHLTEHLTYLLTLLTLSTVKPRIS
jgi:hypothetical protein